MGQLRLQAQFEKAAVSSVAHKLLVSKSFYIWMNTKNLSAIYVTNKQCPIKKHESVLFLNLIFLFRVESVDVLGENPCMRG